MTIGFVVWLFGTAVLLMIIFSLNSGAIVAQVSRRILFPAFEQALDPLHSDEQRRAFSNACARYVTTQKEQETFQPSSWTYPVLNQLVQDSRDGLVSRAESATFISSVWHHAAGPHARE